MGQLCTDSLTGHRREREVLAALWSQPCALPSTLETKWAGPSPNPRGPTPNLARADQNRSTDRARPSSLPNRPNHLKPPLGLQAQVTKLGERLLACSLFKCFVFLHSFRCGTKYKHQITHFTHRSLKIGEIKKTTIYAFFSYPNMVCLFIFLKNLFIFLNNYLCNCFLVL